MAAEGCLTAYTTYATYTYPFPQVRPRRWAPTPATYTRGGRRGLERYFPFGTPSPDCAQ